MTSLANVNCQCQLENAMNKRRRSFFFSTCVLVGQLHAPMT